MKQHSPLSSEAHNLRILGSTPISATIAPELDITPVKIVRQRRSLRTLRDGSPEKSRLPVLRNRSGLPGFNLSGNTLGRDALLMLENCPESPMGSEHPSRIVTWIAQRSGMDFGTLNGERNRSVPGNL